MKYEIPKYFHGLDLLSKYNSHENKLIFDILNI